MKITYETTHSADAKVLHAEIDVTGILLSAVNGMQIFSPLELPNTDCQLKMRLEIELDTGTILNWPKETSAILRFMFNPSGTDFSIEQSEREGVDFGPYMKSTYIPIFGTETCREYFSMKFNVSANGYLEGYESFDDPLYGISFKNIQDLTGKNRLNAIHK